MTLGLGSAGFRPRRRPGLPVTFAQGQATPVPPVTP